MKAVITFSNGTDVDVDVTDDPDDADEMTRLADMWQAGNKGQFTINAPNGRFTFRYRDIREIKFVD